MKPMTNKTFRRCSRRLGVLRWYHRVPIIGPKLLRSAWRREIARLDAEREAEYQTRLRGRLSIMDGPTPEFAVVGFVHNGKQYDVPEMEIGISKPTPPMIIKVEVEK